MVFLETGLEKDTGASASESSSARRERGTCRWRRGADKVMMEVERESRKAQTEMPQTCQACQGHYEENYFRLLRASHFGIGRQVLLSF